MVVCFCVCEFVWLFVFVCVCVNLTVACVRFVCLGVYQCACVLACVRLSVRACVCVDTPLFGVTVGSLKYNVRIDYPEETRSHPHNHALTNY